METTTAQTAPAVGAGAEGAPAGGGLSQLMMFPVLLVIFYFLLIRPQRQEQKAQEAMIAALQKGDRVVTISGLHGVVDEVRATEVVLEAAPGVKLTIDKVAVKRRIVAEG